ncbi:unnamed protein product [Oikopleura dioica]|uniref:Uncharacterized protein n=1 Tax=Oikopleura dioica TaxID=34765 RepID=E4Z542_OIKDI|nr:unnamed protein product [Oikopleura dioica]
MRAKQRNDSFYQNFALCFGVHPRLGEVSKEMLEDKMVILEKSHLEINDFEWPDTHTPSPNWKEI